MKDRDKFSKIIFEFKVLGGTIMNINYIILATKEFNNKYPGIGNSLAYGFSCYPDDDYYYASAKINECFKAFHVTENAVSFDINFCNTAAKGRGSFIITAIYDSKSEPFYVIPEPWNYVEDMIERCTNINLDQTAIAYDKFFDEFEGNLKNMSSNELSKFIPEAINIQIRVTEFYSHLMIADKTGYLLPKRYQNNLYWRLPRSIKWEDKV